MTRGAERRDSPVRPLSRAVIDAFKVFAGGLPEVLHVFVLSGGDD
ncbi:hypothetical protein RKD49_000311 [Streptomyces glaucescens]